jgi:pimeloyl-ACP methyl ester carboxylesterase
MIMDKKLYIYVYVVSILIYSVSQAQDPKVFFMHGLDGSTSTWNGTATSLESNYVYIDAQNIGYDSDPSIYGIAGAYNSNLDANSIVVGYSLGGLVARQIHHTASTRHKVGKLITVDTPHMGTMVIPGVTFGIFEDIIALWTEELAWGPYFSIIGLFGQFMGNDPPSDFWEDAISESLEVLGWAVGGYASAFAEDYIGNRGSTRDLGLMTPTILNLNFQEIAFGNTMPSARYSLVGMESDDSYNSHIRLAQSFAWNGTENGDWLDVHYRFAAAYFANVLFYYYLSWDASIAYDQTGDPYYRAVAEWYWLTKLGWEVGLMNLVVMQDLDWSNFNGSLEYLGNGYYMHYYNDGLLPSHTQAPEDLFSASERLILDGINHNEATSSSTEVLNTLTEALTRPDIGIVARP